MLRRILKRSSTIVYNKIRFYSLEAYQDHLLDQSLQQKILKVAVIGTPNSGKSTFINYLMDRKVCPTSRKVHTTRTRSKAIFTYQDSQIIFLDTPGLVNEREQKKHKLEKSFLTDSKNCLKDADLIGVIHDASNAWTRETLDIKVINLLEEYVNVPSILILNKVDLIKSKRKLLDVTRLLTENCLDGKIIPYSKPIKNRNMDRKGWKHFKEIFMVSSLTGDGLDSIRDYLVNCSYPSKWLYPEETWTDQSKETLIVNTVKATLLDFLPQEIPYLLIPQMELFEEDEESIKTVVLVKGGSERLCKLVAGDGDGRLRNITEVIQKDLQSAFFKHVRIRIVLVPNRKES